MREIPFGTIQFPLWEHLKSFVAKNWSRNGQCEPYQSAICGAIAGKNSQKLNYISIFCDYRLYIILLLKGGVAAGITTPMDVAKTRITLAKVINLNFSRFTIRKIKQKFNLRKVTISKKAKYLRQ